MAKAKSENSLLIEVPVLREIPDQTYCVRHVEAQLSGSEARVLKRLLHTLEFEGAELADGTHVTRPPHAVRWLLEKVGAAV